MHACAYFCYKRVHCGIWDKCTVGFVKLIYCIAVVIPREERLSLVLSTTNVSAWRCVLPEICRGVSLAVTLCSDVIINAMASQITGVSIVYSTVCSGADQRKHQSSPSRAFGREIHRWSVNSPDKGPVTWKMFPFGDVIRAVVNCATR